MCINYLKSLVICLIILLNIGCASIDRYDLKIQKPDNSGVHDYNYIKTISNNNISISMGSLRESGYMGDIGIGVILSNNSNRSIKLSSADFSVTVNNKPVSFVSGDFIDKYAGLESITAGINAGAASLARSSQGGYGVSDNKYSAERRDYGQALYESVVNGLQQFNSKIISYSKQRFNIIDKDVKEFWQDNVSFRNQLLRNFKMSKIYYLRDMVLKSGHSTFRILWLDSDSIRKLQGIKQTKYNDVKIRVTVGGSNYDYGFKLDTTSKPSSKDAWRKSTISSMIWNTCNTGHEFMQCYKVTRKQCRKVIHKSVIQCLNTLDSDISDPVSTYSAILMEYKLGSCVATEYKKEMSSVKQSSCDNN